MVRVRESRVTYTTARKPQRKKGGVLESPMTLWGIPLITKRATSTKLHPHGVHYLPQGFFGKKLLSINHWRESEDPNCGICLWVPAAFGVQSSLSMHIIHTEGFHILFSLHLTFSVDHVTKYLHYFFLPRKSPNKQKTEKGRIKYSLISKLQKITVLEPPSKIALHKYIDKKWYIQVLQKPYEERMIKIWIKLHSFSSFLSKIKEEIGYKYPRNKWLLCCRIF